MKDLISVIIPIYNVEEYLNRCVESVTGQTYKNLEIILVDDGSPDNCPTLCDEWAERDDRIKVIHKKNGGLSDARNAGIDIATGEFYLFVDSDDYIELNLCEDCMNRIRDDIDIIAFDYRRVYDTYSELKNNTENFKEFSNKEGFKCYIERNPFTHMAWDKLYRRTVFDGVRYPKGRLAEDMATSYRTFAKARKVGYLDKMLYNYYIRKNSIMGEKSYKLLWDAYKGELEAYEYGKKHYPELMASNNTRILNQSMKAYLKMQKVYNAVCSDNEKNVVLKVIDNIDKDSISVRAKMFYYVFTYNKSIAWTIFKLFHLS